MAAGGRFKESTTADLPGTTISAILVELAHGGVREPHWHDPNEWAYILKGRCRWVLCQMVVAETARNLEMDGHRCHSSATLNAYAGRRLWTRDRSTLSRVGTSSRGMCGEASPHIWHDGSPAVRTPAGGWLLITFPTAKDVCLLPLQVL